MWCGYWPISREHGDVMPSSCLVKRCYGIQLFHFAPMYWVCVLTDCLVLSCAMQSNGVATWAFSDDWKWWHIKSLHFVWFSAAMTKFYAIYPVIWHHNINVMAHNLGSFNVYKSTNFTNKSDISYLKTSRAFDVLIHSGKPNSVG